VAAEDLSIELEEVIFDLSHFHIAFALSLEHLQASVDVIGTRSIPSTEELQEGNYQGIRYKILQSPMQEFDSVIKWE
jgi:hypothetical protein